jgi:PmbA protein
MEMYKAAFADLPSGVETAEAVAMRHDETALHVKGGEQSDCSSFIVSSVSVTVTKGGGVGRANSGNINDDPETLIAKAAENADYVRGERESISGFSVNAESADGGESTDDMLRFCVNLEKAALALDGVSEASSCYLRKRAITYESINSKGISNRYSENSFIAHIGIKLKSGAKKPVTAGVTLQRKLFSDLDYSDIARRAVEKARLTGAELETESPENGNWDTVISGDVASSIMIIAWMGIVGSHINKSSAIRPFDPSSIISYEKTSPETWANRTRQSARRIEASDGILRTPVNREGKVIITSTPSKLYIEPSGNSAEDLLRRMGTGLFVTDAYDVIHSVSPSNGDFSIICDGVLYENGRPKSRFERMVMYGNMQDLLRNVKDTDDEPGYSEFMQKAYAYGSPSLLAGNMMFAGAK